MPGKTVPCTLLGTINSDGLSYWQTGSWILAYWQSMNCNTPLSEVRLHEHERHASSPHMAVVCDFQDTICSQWNPDLETQTNLVQLKRPAHSNGCQSRGLCGDTSSVIHSILSTQEAILFSMQGSLLLGGACYYCLRRFPSRSHPGSPRV